MILSRFEANFFCMMLFSTVLFVSGNPVGYKVIEEDRNRLSLNPAENPNREVIPPVMQAKNEGGLWRVEGTQDRDLIDQVLEDISVNLPFGRRLQSATLGI